MRKRRASPPGTCAATGIDHLKKLMKEKAISEDDEKRHETEVQKVTDKAVGEIDQALVGQRKGNYAGLISS